MRSMSIDIETRSAVDLNKSGVYRYANDPSFTILLFSYSVDAGPVEVLDLTREPLPQHIIDALADPLVVKWAFNANFERVCLSAFLGTPLDPRQWKCSMVWATSLGLPASLESVATALNLPVKKDATGKKLIRTFSLPTKDGTFIEPESDRVAWQQFIDYNQRDVEVEVAIQHALADHPLPASEWEAYWLDQSINDRGIRIDTSLARNALEADTTHRAAVLARAQELTGLDNPNSPIQLREWLAAHNCPIPSLSNADVTAAMSSATGEVAQMLALRGQLAKSSVKKYQAMLNVAGADNRARGLIQFYGAGRTGRFAGRLVQVHNLPRNYLPDLNQARALLACGDGEAIDLLYPSLADTLSQLIRTAFIPTPGHSFVVADFSAIEARVLAWLARQQSTLAAFTEGKDLYCATASHMFGVRVEKHGINSDLRQKGKIAVLACGYQGSVGALKAMGALTMGLKESELQPIVDAWRVANPNVVTLWADVDTTVKDVITSGQTARLDRLTFCLNDDILFIRLPSGRSLAYQQPRIGTNRFGHPSITYMGLGSSRKWERIETYGGKLVENIVQAIARDILVHAMTVLEQSNHRIVMHVHDEVVIDHPGTGSNVIEEVCRLMSTVPAWARGLPLDADGYTCDFYMKD